MFPLSRFIAILAITTVLTNGLISDAYSMEDDLAFDMGLEETEEPTEEPASEITQNIAQQAAQTLSSAVKKAKNVTTNIIPANTKATPETITNNKPALPLLTRVKNKKSFSTEEIENWVISQEDINTCMENGKTMLIYLVAGSNNTEAVKFLIDNGADLHTHCTPQYEALFVAIKEKASVPMIETLVNNNANIVTTDEDGNTALMLAAAYHPNSDTITSLLEYGLKIDSKNKFGYDALTLAAYNNSLPVLQTILNNQINTNPRDNNGRTPLMAAAIRGNDMIMRFLINQGADFNATDNNGVSVLDYYNKRHYLKTLPFKQDSLATLSEKLKREYDFISQNHLKYNAMLQNGIYGQTPDATIAEAIANNADIDKPDNNGCTTLINASAINTPTSVLEKLLNAKADINASCNHGKNALMHIFEASETNFPAADKTEKANLLTEHGINTNATDENGNTALLYAIRNNAPSGIIQILLDANANPNIADNTGETPLITAVKQNAPKTVSLLLANGADANKADNKMETPLRYAVKADVNPLIIKSLLKHNADTQTPDINGLTPLWYALKNHANTESTVFLAYADKNLNQTNSEGDTPLLYALTNDLPSEIVKALLANNANPQIKNRSGKNAYDILKSKQYFSEALKKQTREHVLDGWN